MKESFGFLPSGEETFLYTISCGGMTAAVSDYGATLVRLLVPDSRGKAEDVVLGYDDCNGYRLGTCFLGAIVGRSANRIAGAGFELNGKKYFLTPNEGRNNLHSGPDCYHLRMWSVVDHRQDSITLELHSPDGDQGYPGNAVISVTYRLDSEGGLHIVYDGRSDQDTIFNLTNHSYFNLAGEGCQRAAMEQNLSIAADYFHPSDAQSIPTGEIRSVEGSPMDFRSPKPIGRDIDADYECLKLQSGFDHNWVVSGSPCAVLSHPESGRAMEVYTACPGDQFYAGNFLQGPGKAGAVYGRRGGICLETQYYPDSIHHPDWPQPITGAGEAYHSETVYRFKW